MYKLATGQFNASYERKTNIKFAVLQFHFGVLNEIIV